MRRDVRFYKADESGEFQYIGKYFRFTSTGQKLQLRKRALFALSLLSFAAFLAAGMLDKGETRAAYVLAPYIVGFLPGGLGIAAAFHMLGMDDKMTEPQYRRGPKQLARCARFGFFLGAATFVGCIVRMILLGEVTLAFPAATAAYSGAWLAVWRIYQIDPVRESK